MLRYTRKKFNDLYRAPKAGYFLASMLIFGISVGLYSGILNNYLHEILHITRAERGYIEFPRELPGLLLFAIIALLYRFTETRIMQLAFIISILGLTGLGLTGDTRLVAIILIVMWSTGEHLMMPVRSSLAMHLAAPGKEGLALGGVGSMGNTGMLIGHYLVPFLFLFLPVLFGKRSAFFNYRVTLLVAAGFLIAGFWTVSRLHLPGRQVKREKFFFRKKHGRYYILEVFFGARKQVFMTFAPYVLILKYGARTELIASLYGIWSVSNIFIAPALGRLIDRIGYKKIIVTDTILLIIICILYGTSHLFLPKSIAFPVICCVFVADAILFVVGMARAMYVKSLSGSQEEITSTLSTGLSVNHLVSIVIAILGGLLWKKLGMEMLFGIAGLFGLGSFLFSLTLPGRQKTGAHSA